jgi:hypothetical protein
MGAVAMEAMPHQKGLGNPRSPSSSYSPTRNFKKSPGFILRNPRSHRDLPVRLNHKLLKRSSDDDLTPPPSPKRAHSGSGGRLSKLSKRDENGESLVHIYPHSDLVDLEHVTRKTILTMCRCASSFQGAQANRALRPRESCGNWQP